MAFDTEKEIPIDLSEDILFAYPLSKRENWIDMLILREYYSRPVISQYLELNNLNYTTYKNPYFLSNLLTVRNEAFSLATRTEEYVVIMKKTHYNFIEDVKAYTSSGKNSKLVYEGITCSLLKRSEAD